jgi:cobalt-zinc-cadmium efflux system membrane fusion protein
MKYSTIVLLTMSIFFFACTGKKGAEANSDKVPSQDSVKGEMVSLTPEQLKNANLEFGQLVDTTVQKLLKVNGHMDVPPSNMVSISIPLGGYLKKTDLIPGTYVKKGSVIAIMEDPSYIELQQDYLTAISKLSYLEADYTRQKALNETKTVSDKVYQAAKSDFETQKYLVKSLSEKLKLIGLNPASLNEDNISRTVSFYAPINGYVSKVNVNIGKYVTPTDILFEIIDPSDLHLRLTVLDNDAANLQIGNTVSFYANSNVNEKHIAHVAVITPNITEEGTTDVHCHLVNEKIKLFPGTFVNAEVSLNNAKVKALPEAAIVKWQNKDFVFVKLTESNYKMLPVETGVNSNGYVEIKTDLGNQQVVTKNAFTLLMKLKNSAEE